MEKSQRTVKVRDMASEESLTNNEIEPQKGKTLESQGRTLESYSPAPTIMRKGLITKQLIFY